MDAWVHREDREGRDVEAVFQRSDRETIRVVGANAREAVLTQVPLDRRSAGILPAPAGVSARW
jgi:hypothetical protein